MGAGFVTYMQSKAFNQFDWTFSGFLLPYRFDTVGRDPTCIVHVGMQWQTGGQYSVALMVWRCPTCVHAVLDAT